MNFWCKKCKIELEDKNPIEKNNRWIIVIDGTDVSYREKENYLTWFETKCIECNLFLKRYPGRVDDPYYYQSNYVKMMRDKYKNDLIQPGDDKFKTHYREQWLKDEAAKEQKVIRDKQKKDDKENFYKKHLLNPNTANMARKLMDAEEQI